MKLHQLLAILPSVKKNAAKAKTEIYHTAQKGNLFKGLSRTYSPKDEDGYQYPPESTPVQMSAADLVSQFVLASTELYNLAATQDKTNTQAIADVEVDGTVILRDIPVSNLLFLEKQLEDVKTFISSLPVLDLDKAWTHDPNRGSYVTAPRLSTKTKKITKPVVLYEATKEHPAQVKEVSEDIIEGTWTAIDLSGGLPKDVVTEILKRIDDLSKAVVVAREKANGIDVEMLETADPIFNFIFDSLLR